VLCTSTCIRENLRVIATQFNAKTEICRRPLFATQILELIGLYRPNGNTLLPVLEIVNFNYSQLINNQIAPREKAIIENLPNNEIAASELIILGDIWWLTVLLTIDLLHSFTNYLEIICVYLCPSALHLRFLY